MMRARLERDVEGRSTRLLPGGGESASLCVRQAGALVPALTDDSALADDDCADERIRPGRSTAALGKLERSRKKTACLSAVLHCCEVETGMRTTRVYSGVRLEVGWRYGVAPEAVWFLISHEHPNESEIGAWKVFTVEDRAACDEKIRARLVDRANVVGADPAVDLNVHLSWQRLA